MIVNVIVSRVLNSTSEDSFNVMTNKEINTIFTHHTSNLTTNLAHSIITIIEVDAILSPSKGSGFPFRYKMIHSRMINVNINGVV